MESRYGSKNATPMQSRLGSPTRSGDTKPKTKSRDNSRERENKDFTHGRPNEGVTDHVRLAFTIAYQQQQQEKHDLLDNFSGLRIGDTYESTYNEAVSQQWEKFERQASEHYRAEGEAVLSDFEYLETDLKNFQETLDKAKNLWSTWRDDSLFFLYHSMWGDSPQFRYQRMQDYQSDGSISSNIKDRRHRIVKPVSIISTLLDNSQEIQDRYDYYSSQDEIIEAHNKRHIRYLKEKVEDLHNNVKRPEEWERTFESNPLEEIENSLSECTRFIKESIEWRHSRFPQQ